MHFSIQSLYINGGGVDKCVYISRMYYDIRMQTPFSIILSGSLGSGKTTFLERFISTFDKITDGSSTSYPNLLWFSGTNQPELLKRITSSFHGTVRFFDLIDSEIYSKIELEGRNSMIVLDDLMHEMSGMSDIGKLFTKGRSHLNCNVILLWQNVFPKGPEMRNLSINAQDIVIFKNPRDKCQIRVFAQQVASGRVQSFLEAFQDCTRRSYGYLYCDFSQSTPEEIRYKTNILPDQQPVIVYKI